MNSLLTLFIVVPFIAFLSTLFLQNKSEKPITKIVQFAKFANIIIAGFFIVYWVINGKQTISYTIGTLYKTEHFVFALQLYYDKVSAVFSIVGAILFFLVATFSKYNMHRDEGFKRFFNTILLFGTAYNIIIIAGNFETIFIGWEIKGLCSFILIAFYRNRYLPIKNAFKAISYYRLSDVALMLAMWMMHHLTHQNVLFAELGNVKELANVDIQTGVTTFIVCMLIIPAAIKSAQFPFTTWLPRAMEGPTASSAIFYGSLSVHIGVFLLLRTYPFWEDMIWAKIVTITIGTFTAIVASMIARVQPTVKTQIAYSSAAQIGLMFIEVALGLHWLALIHFAGNAFLRTYQLLVSPSVLNYLVHQQYFHYTKPLYKNISKIKASFYMLSVKEFNMDGFMFTYIWSPFKWLGKQLLFLQANIAIVFVSLAGVVLIFWGYFRLGNSIFLSGNLPILLMSIALLLILFAFAFRGSALKAWVYILLAHFYILSAILFNASINLIEITYYLTGVLFAFLLGYFCLQKINKLDNDINLNKFHGYVYEQNTVGFLFLVATIGMVGFPITFAFVGIDVIFTYIQSNQIVLIIFMAICFIFIELAAFRILLRIFYGAHKKLNHPVAFRST